MDGRFNPTIAGLVAGASGVVVGHPFDTLKTRVQVGHSTSGLGIRTLYRGIFPPLLTVGLIQGANFSMIEYFKPKFMPQRPYDDRRRYLCGIFASASSAGSILSLMTNPIGLVKVQQQVATEHGMIRCAVDLYKKYGIKVFYRGYSCGFIMESFGRGMYLITYESVKTLFVPPGEEAPLKYMVLAAGPAGIVGWLSVYPVDLIKSRMMLDCCGTKFPTLRKCIVDTWQEGGIRRMYRGLGFSMIRAAPVAAMVLPVYETTKNTLDLYVFI